MPGAKSGASAVRARPRALTTDADLEQDQESFLRANLEPQSAEAAIAALSFGRSEVSATAELLQPIAERKVTRRRRRPPNANVENIPFPPVETVGQHAPRFARNRPASSSLHQPSSQDQDHKPRQEDESLSSLQLENMTQQQIREAQEEIAALLSPENIEFLRARGRVRLASTRGDTHEVGGTTVSDSDNVEDQSRTRTDVDGENDVSPSEEGVMNDGEKFGEENSEEDKLMWMMDANTEVPSQKELGEMLLESVRQLGELGNRRFNLSGKLLSPAEVESLPSHLGLHHHGASPASAGYTLSEILLLTRSTVPSQRTLSLRMFADIISSHFDEVVNPMVSSGSLAVAFAAFPSQSAREMGKTGEQAYVEAVEALVSRFSDTSAHELVPGLYFGSRFYSSTLEEVGNTILDALSETGCIPALAQIAKLSATRDGSSGVALRCLGLIRLLAQYCTEASRVALGDPSTCRILMDMAVGLDSLQPWTSLLACDTLAHAISRIASRSPEALDGLKGTILNASYLQKVAVHLHWFMRPQSNVANSSYLEAAMGAMRLLRSALSLEEGVLAFTAVAQGVSRLTREKGKVSAEAYLALEAYAHSLYVQISTSGAAGRRELSTASVQDSDTDKLNEHERFAKDQLTELVPVALSAANEFTSHYDRITSTATAACGHFGATLLALTTIQPEESVIVRTLNQCSASSQALKLLSVTDFNKLKELQALASICHAGARLLSRMKLDATFARREVTYLMEGVYAESCFLARCSRTPYPWRCVANACAEWIGSLAKVECNRSTVELALEVLQYLLDPQVLLDLLSRCLLRADFLKSLDPAMTTQEAQKCATDIISNTLPDFSKHGDLHKLKSGEQDSPDGMETGHVIVGAFSMCNMISSWLKHDEISESALRVARCYSISNLLPPQELFWSILCSPPSLHVRSQHLFEYIYLFANNCVKAGESLFPSKAETTLQVSSTSPNSIFSDALLAMADSLVSRGPAAQAHIEVKDPLSSLVFTFMCNTAVDVSLRQSLWRKTVEECGGGGLYHHAHDLHMSRPSEDLAEGDGLKREEDTMIIEYVNAIVSGFFVGERCSRSLGKVVCSALAERLISGREDRILATLKDRLVDGDATSWDSMRTILQVNESNQSTHGISMWLESLK